MACQAMMDWSLCVLCQVFTVEKLVDPSQNTRKDTCGYTTLASNLIQLQEIHKLPACINIANLSGECVNLEKNLRKNHAVWHRSCFTKVNSQKVERALSLKRKQPVSVHTNPAKKSLQSCLFCGMGSDHEKTYELKTNADLLKWVTSLQDVELIDKLCPSGDSKVTHKYHKTCMTNAHTSYRSLTRKQSMDTSSDCDILQDVIDYTNTYLETSRDIIPYIKLSTIVSLYTDLANKDKETTERVNSTRLKERILEKCPDLYASQRGKDVYLSYKCKMGDAIALANTYQTDTAILEKASEIIRNDVNATKQTFSGTFSSQSQSNAVPSSLLSTIESILMQDKGKLVAYDNRDPMAGEPERQVDNDVETAHNLSTYALSIAQLIVFNSASRRSRTQSSYRRSTDRETPLAIYVGLLIHSQTRNRQLINKLSNLGICIRYQRVLDISTALGNATIDLYETEGVLCPIKLKRGIFTTAAVDNIDHNTSSRTSMTSFHGTAISITQHPMETTDGEARTPAHYVENSRDKIIHELPDEFTEVTSFNLKSKNVYAPIPKPTLTTETSVNLDELIRSENSWLEKVRSLHLVDTLQREDYLAWSAYQSSILTSKPRTRAITALLPLFREHANNAAMIRHSMNIVVKDTDFLNSGQVAVLTMDQPLYALAKQIQWEDADVSEDKLVVVMGGLHIEMCVLDLLGDLLTDSGWIEVLTESNVTTEGRAQSVLSGKHVTRSRYCHEVSASVLYCLKSDAYRRYIQSVDGGNRIMSQDEWEDECEKLHPQFKYWQMIMKLELLLLEYVRSLRVGDFHLYVKCLQVIVQWMFALDHTNYSRWLSVHIRDMLLLKTTHPTVYEHFIQGKFVTQKTENQFSMMALDQCHEQENALIKGAGGAIGITENDAALRRWLVAGPETARVISEFERTVHGCREPHDTETSAQKHHDQTGNVQSTFLDDVKQMKKRLQELNNPFEDKSSELHVLDTKLVAGKNIVNSHITIDTIGLDTFTKFFADRLISCTTPISDTIKRNSLPLFSSLKKSKNVPVKTKAKSLANDCKLFSRLFIASQSRKGDIGDFFMHENQATPPSLSAGGDLRCNGKKCELLGCLPIPADLPTECPKDIQVKVLDGAAIVNSLKPSTTCKSFADYVEINVIPYVCNIAKDVQRVDLVWDVYLDNSLKSSQRDKRGMGVRRKVTKNGVIPKDWQKFMRCSENKKELFEYIGRAIVDNGSRDNVVIVSTCNEDVLCTHDISDLTSCNHEEADSRIFVHVLNASKTFRHILIKTVDTDVVVIAISAFAQLNVESLWIEFGVGGSRRYIPIHDIVSALSPQTCRGLPFFHSFSGADTTSSFANKGKKSFWDTWLLSPDATDVFCRLSQPVDDVSSEDMQVIERFVVRLYSRSSTREKVNHLREDLFGSEDRSIENIPPTAAALKQHVLRAVYQAAHVWGQSLLTSQVLPDPALWGWELINDHWGPSWTTLPEAAKACRELIRCRCKVTCGRNCKCTKSSLACTALCLCLGKCSTNTHV